MCMLVFCMHKRVFMCTYKCLCVHGCEPVCVSMCSCALRYAYVHVGAHVYTSGYICLCVHACTFLCVLHVHVCACMCAPEHTCVRQCRTLGGFEATLGRGKVGKPPKSLAFEGLACSSAPSDPQARALSEFMFL